MTSYFSKMSFDYTSTYYPDSIYITTPSVLPYTLLGFYPNINIIMQMRDIRIPYHLIPIIGTIHCNSLPGFRLWQPCTMLTHFGIDFSSLTQTSAVQCVEGVA